MLIRESYYVSINFVYDIPIIHADPDCIYYSIKWLLDNKETLDIGLKSIVFVEKQHDVKLLTKKLTPIYKNL